MAQKRDRPRPSPWIRNRDETPAAATRATPTTISKDDTLMSTSTTTSQTSSPFSRLPRELQDRIYVYMSFTEATWIGGAHVADKEQDTVVERNIIHKPAASIKTEHSIILVSREVRDDFRCAVWHGYMTTDRDLDLRLYDFTTKPIRDFLASCSPYELQKLGQEKFCRVNIRFTGAFRRYFGKTMWSLFACVRPLVIGWMLFCEEVGLDARYSLDGCVCCDILLIRTVLAYRGRMHLAPNNKDWKQLQTTALFKHLLELSLTTGCFGLPGTCSHEPPAKCLTLR